MLDVAGQHVKETFWGLQQGEVEAEMIQEVMAV